MKLWKVNVMRKDIKDKNVSTEEDIVQKLGGKEIELQELFEEYFQDELDHKNFKASNIHIIATTGNPVSAIGKCLNVLLLEQEISIISPFIFIRSGKRKTEEFNLGEENISQNSKKERLTGFTFRSTPESIVEYLLEQKGLKDDFSKPHKLCANLNKLERKGREGSFYDAYKYILDQHFKVKLARDNKLDLNDKIFYPLFALQSTPGGGKSYFLDEFASLKKEDLNSFKQKNLNDPTEIVDCIIKELCNSVSTCISYNGSSVYVASRDGDGGVKGLVMRIIWSYFFDGTKLPWAFFCNQFEEKFGSLDILTATQSIIHHSGKSVLLCVDEIMKIDNENHSNIISLLNNLYTPYHSLATKDKKFRFIITTLDAICLWDTQTALGRQINWIPLRRLEFSESIELFKEVIKKLESDSRVSVLCKCISGCNGHPRTLEKFYELLSNTTALTTYGWAALIEELTKKIVNWFVNYITFPVVKLALLGEYVRLDTMVKVTACKELSVKDLITSGVYINSVTNQDDVNEVIPTLTLVSLYYFCMKTVEGDDAKTVARILKNLFHVEDHFDLKSNDGKAFEKFHMNLELLYRALHHRNKDDHEDRTEMGLHEIYGLCLPNQSKEVKIRIQRKNIVTLHMSIEFPSKDGKINDSRGIEINDHLDKYMFVPTKSNNSGFEMVMFEEKANGGGYIALNIECKFSWPESKTVLSMVWRDIGKLDDEILNNKNIIIVGRKELEKIYSPSLVSRPQFYGDIQKKIEN
ncbi:hypothetical protein RIR_jg12171.t1 [Rhizophagus irregularis DAOM 181602=DAOM 197198]|nr:hypothetical protein RIR_jg12171.t1 [Rhizophagus irregularis DAOM 181602=DAOM 197198]